MFLEHDPLGLKSCYKNISMLLHLRWSRHRLANPPLRPFGSYSIDHFAPPTYEHWHKIAVICHELWVGRRWTHMFVSASSKIRHWLMIFCVVACYILTFSYLFFDFHSFTIWLMLIFLYLWYYFESLHPSSSRRNQRLDFDPKPSRNRKRNEDMQEWRRSLSHTPQSLLDAVYVLTELSLQNICLVSLCRYFKLGTDDLTVAPPFPGRFVSVSLDPWSFICTFRPFTFFFLSLCVKFINFRGTYHLHSWLLDTSELNTYITSFIFGSCSPSVRIQFVCSLRWRLFSIVVFFFRFSRSKDLLRRWCPRMRTLKRSSATTSTAALR